MRGDERMDHTRGALPTGDRPVLSLEFSDDSARCRKLMATAGGIYRGPVVSPVAGGDVELIGDEELGDGDDTGVDNPRSQLDPAARRALRELLGDGVRFDEPMRRHTTLKIGGPADAFAAPARAPEVAGLARWCAASGVPLTVVGGGSNLIVRDGGIRGVVLATRRLRGLAL